MDVTTKCPKCGLMLALDTSEGDEFECPQCGQRLTIQTSAAKARPVKRPGPPRRTASSRAPPASHADDIDWSIPEIPQNYLRRKRRQSVELDPAVVWSMMIVGVCILALVIGGVYFSKRGSSTAAANEEPAKGAAAGAKAVPLPAGAGQQAAAPPGTAPPAPMNQPSATDPTKADSPSFEGPAADQIQQAQNDLAARFGRNKTVMIVGLGFNGGDAGHLTDQLTDLVKKNHTGTEALNFNTLSANGWAACVYAPVEDLDGLAKQIDFATVTLVSAEQRRITVTPKKG